MLQQAHAAPGVATQRETRNGKGKRSCFVPTDYTGVDREHVDRTVVSRFD